MPKSFKPPSAAELLVSRPEHQAILRLANDLPSDSDFVQALSRAFPKSPTVEIGLYARVGRYLQQTPARANTLRADQVVPEVQIPINEKLFGKDPSSRRYLYRVRFTQTNPSTGEISFIYTNITAKQNLTVGEVIAEARRNMLDREIVSPLFDAEGNVVGVVYSDPVITRIEARY